MGLAIARMWDSWFGDKESKILMVGLDAAGKTTILYKLKIGDVVATIPTIGFNMETVQYKNVSFSVWDVGGQDKIRVLWRHYYEGINGIIFVVDSNDVNRMEMGIFTIYNLINIAKEELNKLMSEELLKTAVLLVYANKQDLPNALKAPQIAEKLGLAQLNNRKWFIQACCATTGDGLYEGLEWLSSQF